MLEQLKANGVWLVDSSIHSVCKPGGARVPQATVAALQRIWWEHIGMELLSRESPQRICAIGKAVSKTLARLECL